MKRLAAILCLLLLSGCVGDRTGGAIWWNPTTWASRAAPASVDRAEEKRDQATDKVAEAEQATVHAANHEVAKALEVLASAPASRPVELARRFTGNAHNLLNEAAPLSVKESTELRQLIADLLSENQRVREAAERVVDHQEQANARLAADLTAARANLERREAALAAANANLREAYDRENALANQVRNFWFVLGALALLWVGGTILGAVAKVYPPLAPVSRAVNGLAAPTLAFAEARATDGLRRVGRAMAVAKQKLPQAADQLVQIFDQETDADHQRAIGAAANSTP